MILHIPAMLPASEVTTAGGSLPPERPTLSDRVGTFYPPSTPTRSSYSLESAPCARKFWICLRHRYLLSDRMPISPHLATMGTNVFLCHQPAAEATHDMARP